MYCMQACFVINGGTSECMAQVLICCQGWGLNQTEQNAASWDVALVVITDVILSAATAHTSLKHRPTQVHAHTHQCVLYKSGAYEDRDIKRMKLYCISTSINRMSRENMYSC